MPRPNTPSLLRRVPKKALVAACALAALGIAGGVWLWRPWSGATPPDDSAVADVSLQPPPLPVEPAPRPVEFVAFADGCATAACHPGYLPDARVHEPVAAGACDACHQPDAGGHVFPLLAEPGERCAACHDVGGRHGYPHAALASEGCVACHDPHASEGPALLVAATVGETCAACHPGTGGAHAHAPYTAGECTSCHDPHDADNPLLLHGGQGQDHCALCHSDTINAMSHAQQSHNRLEGECMRCHTAHASPWPGLLLEDASEQCLGCHDSIREASASALATHRPGTIERRCLACHLPHASDEAALLRDRQETACLACHDREIKTDQGRTIPDMSPSVRDAEYRHGPVDHGQCGLCHAEHGTASAVLNGGRDPAQTLGSRDARFYTLCFDCHDAALIGVPESDAVTGFRDGDRNLHHLHVTNAGSITTCSSCHEAHGGSRPMLMAESGSFEGSDWQMPLGFTLTERGGNCAPGCHEPRSYFRGEGP